MHYVELIMKFVKIKLASHVVTINKVILITLRQYKKIIKLKLTVEYLLKTKKKIRVVKSILILKIIYLKIKKNKINYLKNRLNPVNLKIR